MIPVYSFAINQIRPKTNNNTPVGKGSLFGVMKEMGRLCFMALGYTVVPTCITLGAKLSRHVIVRIDRFAGVTVE